MESVATKAIKIVQSTDALKERANLSFGVLASVILAEIDPYIADIQHSANEIIDPMPLRPRGLGVDVSNYSGLITHDKMRMVRNGGASYIIIGTQDWAIATMQYQAALDAGISVEFYWEHGDYPVWIPANVLLWIAVERGSRFDSRDVLYHQHFPVRVGGYGIYTSRSEWRRITGDTDAFASWLLWDAAYGDRDAPFVPYGGWMTRDTIQYEQNVNFNGVHCDLNWRP